MQTDRNIIILRKIRRSYNLLPPGIEPGSLAFRSSKREVFHSLSFFVTWEWMLSLLDIDWNTWHLDFSQRLALISNSLRFLNRLNAVTRGRSSSHLVFHLLHSTPTLFCTAFSKFRQGGRHHRPHTQYVYIYPGFHLVSNPVKFPIV